MVSQAPAFCELKTSLCCSALQLASPVPPRSSQFFWLFQLDVSWLTKLLALSATPSSLTVLLLFCRSRMAWVFQHLPSEQRPLPVAVKVVYQFDAAVPAAKSTVGFQRPSSLAVAAASAAIAEGTPSP